MSMSGKESHAGDAWQLWRDSSVKEGSDRGISLWNGMGMIVAT